jgi:hypothetical protein
MIECALIIVAAIHAAWLATRQRINSKPAAREGGPA